MALVKAVVMGVVVLVVLQACDRIYGPSFRNSFGSEIDVAVTFADGKTFTHTYQECAEFFLGRINDPAPRAIHMTVYKNGKVIHELCRRQLDYFAAKAEEARSWFGSPAIGRIDANGIWLETDPADESAWGCHLGEPIEG